MALLAPYGAWRSPISARVVASEGLRLGWVSMDGDDIYWIEGRPQEGGRNVLVRRAADGTTRDVTPVASNVRTRVHEYGGGAYLVTRGVAFFSNFADQRVYQLRVGDAVALPVTPEGAWFYADFEFDAFRNRLICVREDHTAGDTEPINALVAIPIGGGSPVVIASGYDFYSTPRLSPSGDRLCWICWRHPNMPWDGTELWVADIGADGRLEDARHVCGHASESIYQPGWSPDGELYFSSDRTGFWQICRWDADGATLVTRDVSTQEAEFGSPQWQFGTAAWVFAGSDMLARYSKAGRWKLARVGLRSGRVDDLPTTLEPGEWLAAREGTVVFVGGTPAQPPAVVAFDLNQHTASTLRTSSALLLDQRYVSTAEAIEFPTGEGATAHAFYYAPRNDDVVALAGADLKVHSHAAGGNPADERPPLIVVSHGGPTTAAKATLDLQIQFWTSRGFGVADVNYGGSSGFGRRYRERLNGKWGIVDVEDCINAARYLAASGKVDGRRLAIRGGSAGGYTTLAALTFHPGVFAAGASYYGVCDVEVLARDTHKFESRYLDTLIGPYPAAAAEYRARSPIHFVDRLASPLILLQGLEDKVVPPNQAEMMADAVRAKGLPVALLLFEGEQHGFRRAETIVRSLEAELYFYGIVFGFVPGDRIEPIVIDNT